MTGLWQRSLGGMMTGAGSVLLKTGLNILVIPVMIAHLGLDAFGLYILLIALLEITMLLDLGASNALVKLLGQSAVEDPGRRAYLKVGHGLFALLAGLFLLTGFLMAPGFSDWFQVTPTLERMAPVALLLITLEAALTIYSCYYQSVLLSHCAHQWNNIGDSLYYFIANVGALILLFAGFHLPAVLAVRLLGAMLRLLLVMVQARRLEPFVFRPRVPLNLASVKDVVHLGYHAMMLNFSIIVSHKIDDLVIARFLPLSAVGIYEIVFRFLGIAIQICLKMSEGVFPLFSRMAANQEQIQARRLFLRSSCFLNFSACMLVMLVVSFYPELLRLFSARQVAAEQTYGVLMVAVPCVISGVLQMPAGAWLFTWGHQRYLMVSSILAALANLGLSLILVQALGIVGVALGTLIPQLIQHQASLIRKTCQGLQITFKQYVRDVHGAILLPLALSALWVQLWRNVVSLETWPLVPIGLISLSAALLGSLLWFRLSATDQERELLASHIWLPLQLKLKQKRTVENANG